MFEFAKRDLVEEDCGLGVNALARISHNAHDTGWLVRD